MNLLRQYHVERLRNDGIGCNNGNYDDKPVVIASSGRATCRSCNCKIAKGDPAIKTVWDFTGSGSWTLIPIQIHLGPCQNFLSQEKEEDCE